MSILTEAAHKTKWIPVKNLSVVWSSAQRELNEKRVDRIADDFDPDLFDDLVVTLPNGDGIYHVVDGQHRRAVIQKMYGEDEMVPCRIVDAKDPARAALIFDKINTSRKTPTALERFKVRVTAGSEIEVQISKMLAQLGYRVDSQKAANSIMAVGTLISIYKGFGQEVLKEALVSVRTTWRDDVGATDGPIIEGFAKVIAEHRGHIDWKRLREKTASEFTPGRLLGRGKADRELNGGSMSDGIRRVLIRNYNQGLRTGKLGE